MQDSWDREGQEVRMRQSEMQEKGWVLHGNDWSAEGISWEDVKWELEIKVNDWNS